MTYEKPTAVNHRIRTWLLEYAAVASGAKRFEYRFNDRGYQVGDTLTLVEWDNVAGESTGREMDVRVTYMLESPAFGLPDGYVILSIA